MPPNSTAKTAFRLCPAKGCSGHRPPVAVLAVCRNGDQLVATGASVHIRCDDPAPTDASGPYGVKQSEWLRLRRQVFERDGHRCTYCGSDQAPLHCDHRHSWIKGGETTLANLTTACQPCNNGKRDRSADEWVAILASREQGDARPLPL